jgi:hypothetical protein
MAWLVGSIQGGGAFNYCGGDGQLGGGNDTWVGTSQADNCHGNDGNDNLAGKADVDFLFGDAGSDYLQGDDGYDVLSGGAGTNNRIFGNNGNDELRAQNGNTTDHFVGGNGFNTCYGDWDDSSGAHDETQGCDVKVWNHVP